MTLVCGGGGGGGGVVVLAWAASRLLRARLPQLPDVRRVRRKRRSSETHVRLVVRAWRAQTQRRGGGGLDYASGSGGGDESPLYRTRRDTGG